MNAVHWSATFGLLPGYHHDNASAAVYRARFIEAWSATMDRVLADTGFVISCVMNDSLVIYPKAFGCPEGGEVAVTVSGSSNPDHVKSPQFEDVKAAVEAVVCEVQQQMDQTTVRLEFAPIQSHYFVRKK